MSFSTVVGLLCCLFTIAACEPTDDGLAMDEMGAMRNWKEPLEDECRTTSDRITYSDLVTPRNSRPRSTNSGPGLGQHDLSQQDERVKVIVVQLPEKILSSPAKEDRTCSREREVSMCSGSGSKGKKNVMLDDEEETDVVAESKTVIKKRSVSKDSKGSKASKDSKGSKGSPKEKVEKGKGKNKNSKNKKKGKHAKN